MPLFGRYTTALSAAQVLARATAAPIAATKPSPLQPRNSSCNATLLARRMLYDAPLAFFTLTEASGDAGNCGFDASAANFTTVTLAADIGDRKSVV